MDGGARITSVRVSEETRTVMRNYRGEVAFGRSTYDAHFNFG